MGKQLRVLIVDDSLEDIEQILCELRHGGYDPIYERVETASAMKIELEKNLWDIIISGHSMPFFSGIGALTQLNHTGLDIPFIVVSEAISGDVVVEYMKSGAYDYVRKDNLAQLVHAVERALQETEERSQRKQEEELLRMTVNKYRMLLENLPQRIFYKNKNSIYISCSENLANDLHIKPEEIFGKTDFDFYPEELADKYRKDDRRIMESGETEDIEERYIRDGQEFLIHTVKTPIKDEKGETIGILGIFWDITEKVTLQRDAERSRYLASLGELAAGVAHEINNPINGIINCAQLLANKTKEESIEKDLASRIIREGDRIANIVSSLLSFAQPNDRKEIKSKVHVNELISDTLILTKAQLNKEGIKIRLNILEELPEVYVHPQQIRQVFLNAISNARYALNQKYPETHDDKILEIISEKTVINDIPYVKVTFHDHGMGIPVDVRDKVLDPFFTTKSRHKGTGLGLSISHGIISSHGGKICIDTAEGRFTKFSILLPVESIEKTLKKETK
ncbi:MAG: PAS domain S-box protein [wastewater metagenome]|nr:PAS domain S-box protein [Candidatus Loosdrechtia aerotolerans]